MCPIRLNDHLAQVQEWVPRFRLAERAVRGDQTAVGPRTPHVLQGNLRHVRRSVDVWGQFNFVERVHIKIFLRHPPRDVRAVETAAEEEGRLVVASSLSCALGLGQVGNNSRAVLCEQSIQQRRFRHRVVVHPNGIIRVLFGNHSRGTYVPDTRGQTWGVGWRPRVVEILPDGVGSLVEDLSRADCRVAILFEPTGEGHEVLDTTRPAEFTALVGSALTTAVAKVLVG